LGGTAFIRFNSDISYHDQTRRIEKVVDEYDDNRSKDPFNAFTYQVTRPVDVCSHSSPCLKKGLLSINHDRDCWSMSIGKDSKEAISEVKHYTRKEILSDLVSKDLDIAASTHLIYNHIQSKLVGHVTYNTPGDAIELDGVLYGPHTLTPPLSTPAFVSITRNRGLLFTSFCSAQFP